jgi:putative PIN family toxin of toxin-antitoxin system
VKLVLDTSVLVAALRSHSGASNLLLRMALHQRFELLLSVPLFLEYEAVITRPEHLFVAGLTATEALRLLNTVLDVATPVHLGFFWPESARDPNDAHVLTLAKVGRADALVTHNVKDFTPSAADLGINLYTPERALRRIRS